MLTGRLASGLKNKARRSPLEEFPSCRPCRAVDAHVVASQMQLLQRVRPSVAKNASRDRTQRGSSRLPLSAATVAGVRKRPRAYRFPSKDDSAHKKGSGSHGGSAGASPSRRLERDETRYVASLTGSGTPSRRRRPSAFRPQQRAASAGLRFSHAHPRQPPRNRQPIEQLPAA